MAVSQVLRHEVHLDGCDSVLEHIPGIGTNANVRSTGVAFVQEHELATGAACSFGTVVFAHVHVGPLFVPLVVFGSHAKRFPFARYVVDRVCCRVKAVGDVVSHSDVEGIVQFLREWWFVALGQCADVDDEQG